MAEQPGGMSHPSDVAAIRDAERLSGHTEISWSIVLVAGLAEPLTADLVAGRLRAGWPHGLPPVPEEAGGEGFDDALHDAANRPYASGWPLFRVLVAGGPEPRLALAAHHAAVDGLGLVGLLALALGHPVSSSVKGVGLERPARRLGPAYAARRLLEAVLAPPDRIAPLGGASEPGDHLVRREVAAGSAASAGLVAAAVRAVARWNADRGTPARRLVAAVGASRRPGQEPEIADRSAYFRLRVDDPRTEAVRERLATLAPEPPSPAATGGVRLAARLARPLAGRMGSTLLVSSLGRLATEASLRWAAFFPSAHGRSGVSLGAVTVGERTVLGLRARRRDFSRSAAEDLLGLVAAELPSAEEDPSSR